MNYPIDVHSGGFRGYAGYAAAYPIDWTGCIFVTVNFCPIVWNWIFGHRNNSMRASVSEKNKTLSNEHALMTEVDTDRSLQLVLDQGHGTPIWRAAMLTMYSMLCYRRKCIRRSSTTFPTSSEPSLSCGSNAGMLQPNHPRLHWMHTQHWGRCGVGRVDHGPPKILVGWATMHLASPIIGLCVR